MPRPPGAVRDAILEALSAIEGDASAAEIARAVARRIGSVPSGSVRSYLCRNVPTVFERTGRGRYRLRPAARRPPRALFAPALEEGRARLYHADAFAWLAAQPPASIHAVVTDPPYGLLEYSPRQLAKLRSGRGGVWRIPPSFDGHRRAPLPRFTVLGSEELEALQAFFLRLGRQLARVAVPGANVVVASNPLLAHRVAEALASAGLEPRGTLVRLVRTMRGGDRPKNAHREFDGVSVLPRSMFEPWLVLRKPLEGRVQDNLRRWGTGGFRRPSAERPFGDVIASRPTPAAERRLAPHPSLKPQAFLRQLVRASLPLGTGVVLDPFAGSGSTLAAANAVGYDSVGVEADEAYVAVARQALGPLAALTV